LLSNVWLKLFGPDGPTTFGELREAILNAQFGQGVTDGSLIAALRSLVTSQPNVPARPDPDSLDRNPVAGDGTMLVDLRLPVIPGGAVDEQVRVTVPGTGDLPSGTDVLPVGTVTTDPQNAPVANVRIVTLLVDAPAVAAGLVPIEYGPSNKDDRFGEGWLAALLAQNQAPMQIGWDADTLGSAASDLGILLGPVLGSIELSGDFSAGYTLARQSMDLDHVSLAAGSNYNLVVDANCVAAGQTLLVDGQDLGAANHVAFDGSAVAAGNFNFFGGSGNDTFFGGAGNDFVRGLGGADTLTGGGGSDTFVYSAAGESSGTGYDTLADFNPGQDKIDLPGTVTGFDAAVHGGALSTGSFNADLGAALAGLGAGHAVVYAPDAGDLAGKIFLVVDGNGVAGYQEGEDFVFALPATTLADLSAHPNFFI
jgi:Ca2+-binding RTX toxin-like protein